MPLRRLHNYRRAVFVLAMVVGLIAALAVPAFANHSTDEIRVGVRQNDGDNSRTEFDRFDKSVAAGTQVDFVWTTSGDFHDVSWEATNPEVMAKNGPGAGLSFSVTPTTGGTYYYWCDLHANSGDAAAWFNDPANAGATDTGGLMIGRLVVTVDTTAPVWGAGSATATAVSASQIDLTWPTATDDSGSVSYDIYEASGATQPAKPGAPVASTTSTSASRTGLSAGVHYWYWITAVDGSGNAATPDQQADDTTSSVAASATTQNIVQFSVNPALSISVTPGTVDLGTLNPLTSPTGTGAATVNVSSNDAWTLNLRSIGADGTSGGGDDDFFTSGANQIPVARASWDTGGAATALSSADAIVVTGQPAGTAAVGINYAITLLPTDPAGTNFQTTVLYTVTQP